MQHVAASSGSGGADLEKLCAILDAVPTLKYICLDVANGYSEHFVEFVKMVREKFPKHTIMVRQSSRVAMALAEANGHYRCLQAGNVVTGEMVEELILSGADIIKVGIGPGGCGLGPGSLRWSGSSSLLLPAHLHDFRCAVVTFSRSADGRCRVSVHDQDQNRSGLPSAQRCDRVCRFSSRPEGPHHLCE